MMLALAAMLILLAGSLLDAVAWIVLLRRIRRLEDAAWPPRRTVETRESIEETF
jgi:hypothetical protein